MTPRLAQFAVASLLAGTVGLRAADSEAVEAVFALDALAAMNHLKFIFVGDKQVKILPATLARRETNPVQ
jgi:hypothetical protein